METKASIVAKYREAAKAANAGNGKFVRSDNFGPIAHRFRSPRYDDAEFAEVGHNLVEVKWVEEVDGKEVERKQVWYVQ